MTTIDLCQLMLVAGVAAYLQTLTGFAFGLVMMCAIAILGLISLADAAIIVGILSVVNSVHILIRGWRYVAWREFWLVAGPSLAATIAGYAMLERVAASNLVLLQLILGVVIIAAAVQLVSRPHPLSKRSSARQFIVAGAAGGLMGGLFATAGPPLVYLFYRQPMAITSIRVTLVLVFTVGILLRTTLVVATGDFPFIPVLWSLLTIPVILAATEIAHRWPPVLSPETLRRVTFGLLLASGLGLAFKALI
ncbi:TSUP family transporter [Devosia salina]|uniref:Probable membrane transporter protein n=1 Tax=Devosia salina TaxID=2860336 RepID=A0ABX8WCI3_9HYPH|nr:TSUP family transporter [Devosia salina]QYO76645.1 TSUP family transporter [Devosia salina]